MHIVMDVHLNGSKMAKEVAEECCKPATACIICTARREKSEEENMVKLLVQVDQRRMATRQICSLTH